jgi:hypothetical protein
MQDQYAVIAENDESKWDDNTGVLYHFPERYLKLLTPGTKVIYYKGKLTNPIYASKRLSKKPYYFGYATIGTILPDTNQPKNYFATILDYIPFIKPIPIHKPPGKEYYEVIPPSRVTNYWRDGARLITKEIYHTILSSADIQEGDPINIIPLIPLDNVTPTASINSLLKIQTSKSGNKTVGSGNVQSYYSPNAKKIGDRGEEIVFKYLKETLSTIEAESLRWLAKEKLTPGYDIEYTTDNGVKLCIEVKSTAAKAFTQFLFTINELNAAQTHHKNYVVYLVSECFSQNPKIDKISNPFLQKEQGELMFEPIAFKVFRQE